MKIFLAGCIALSLVSCGEENRTKKELKTFLGSNIAVPEKMEGDFKELFSRNDFNIVVNIEEGDCTPCELNGVKILDLHEETFKSFNTGIVLVVQSEESESVREVMDEMHIAHPVIFDPGKEFSGANKLDENKAKNFFIIDRNRKVVWIGSPVLSSESLKAYRKMMKLLQKKNKV